jgi:hypothetical protein
MRDGSLGYLAGAVAIFVIGIVFLWLGDPFPFWRYQDSA